MLSAIGLATIMVSAIGLATPLDNIIHTKMPIGNWDNNTSSANHHQYHPGMSNEDWVPAPHKCRFWLDMSDQQLIKSTPPQLHEIQM
jgi:hypothetical protein